MGLYINAVHFRGHKHVSALYRAELKNNFSGAKKGMRGWLEWDGRRLVFELDTPIFIEGVGVKYRVVSYAKKLYKDPHYLINSKYKTTRKLMKSLKRIEATDEERIDYFILNYRSEVNTSYNNYMCPVNYVTIKQKLSNFVKNKNYILANKYIKELIDNIIS